MKPHVEHHRTDVLVVGGGLAGTAAAVFAKQTRPDLDVTLIDKATAGRSGQSVFTAGVFLVFIPDEDDFDQWMEEMVRRGEFINDQAWVARYLERVYQDAVRFDSWGRALGKTVFERDEQGRFIRRKSRGHIITSHLVYHSIRAMETMREQCQAVGVQVFNRTMGCSLLQREGQIGGIVAFNVREGTIHVIRARATVLAASGSGFKSTFVGHRNLTGDMLAEAYRQGAELRNMEKTNGNTCSRDHDIHGLNLFVGSGGVFINARGEEFMPRYDEMANRSRLQDLIIAFCREVAEGRGPIYMDMRRVSLSDQQLLRRVLPETFRTWDAAGVKPFQQLIEWVPAFMGTLASGGGLRINCAGETNLSGLYAAGDITDLPPTGSSAMGGVPIGFSLVSGAVAGESAARAVADLPPLPEGACREQEDRAIARIWAPLERRIGSRALEVFAAVQKILVHDVGFIKAEKALKKGLSDLADVRELAARVKAGDYHEVMLAIEAQNQADLAELILGAALCREESRGFHFRPEFPYSDNDRWLKWIVCTCDGGRPRYTTEDVPLPYYKPALARHRPPGLRIDEAHRYGLQPAQSVKVTEGAQR